MATKTETLEEVGSFLDPAISIPIRGKKYRIDAIDIDLGTKLQAQFADAQKQLNNGTKPEDINLAEDDEEENYVKAALGAAYDQMRKDGISFNASKQVLQIVLVWTFQDFDAAKEYFETSGKGRANREQRRTATRTRTAGASTTQKPGSRSTTSNRTKASPGKKS